MEENVEQIINAEESLNSEQESEGQEFTDGAAQPESESAKSTKRVSDRINEIRKQEAEKYQKQYETDLAELNELRKFKQEYELQAEADKRGLSVKDYKKQLEAEEKERAEIVRSDPRFQELEQKVFMQTVAEDLKSLQEAFPEDNITDIRQLDQTFGVLRDAGIDAVTAYKAIRQEQTPQQTTGSSQSKTPNSSVGYSLADIQNMSAQEIADNYEAVMAAYKNY